MAAPGNLNALREDLLRLQAELRDDATRLVNQAQNIERYVDTTYREVQGLIHEKEESFRKLEEATETLASIRNQVNSLADRVRQLGDLVSGVVPAIRELPSHIEVRATGRLTPRWLGVLLLIATALLWWTSGRFVPGTIAAAPQALRHERAVVGMAISGPSPVVLLSLDAAGKVELWWMPSGFRYRELALNGTRAVALSPDGATVAAGDPVSMRVRLWNLPQMREIATLRGHTDSINALAFSEDGNLLISGADDHTAIVWRWREGKRLLTMETGAPVLSVALSPDGSWTAAGCSDQRVWLRRPDGVIQSLQGHQALVRALAFSPDARILASGSGDKTIQLWDSNGNGMRRLEGHTAPVRAVAFSPDGKRLVSGSDDRTVRLWNLETDVRAEVLGHHDSSVTDVDFVPVWGWVASSSEDGTVRFWRVS